MASFPSGTAPLACETDVQRVFLLSPAYCGGRRAGIVLGDNAQFDLACRLRDGGAPLGEVFAFLSGLYFRGKLAYARAFARPPRGVRRALVITPSRGLRDADEPISTSCLREFAAVPVDVREERYRGPLLRDALKLAKRLADDGEVVLLGSVATEKYIALLLPIFGARLRFPGAFVGRGDMSRGGLLLRCVREGRELDYEPVGGTRHGPRPAKLEPLPRVRP
jgi:hypothetical protein